MAHPKEVQQSVRGAYIFEKLPLEQLAVRYRIPARTVKAWKLKAKLAGDDWDTARAAMGLLSRGDEILHANLLADIVQLFQAVLKDLNGEKLDVFDKAAALSRVTDSYHKAVSAVMKATPTLNELGVRLDTIKRLVDFMGQRFPDQARYLVDPLQQFGEQLVRDRR